MRSMLGSSKGASVRLGEDEIVNDVWPQNADA